MRIKPESDPDDSLDIELCQEDKRLCGISILTIDVGISCIYLNLSEVELLQKELGKIAAKIRAEAARA